jgi:hypothetical protein
VFRPKKIIALSVCEERKNCKGGDAFPGKYRFGKKKSVSKKRAILLFVQHHHCKMEGYNTMLRPSGQQEEQGRKECGVGEAVCLRRGERSKT